MVKVGYYYEDCVDPIWDVQTTKITGQDLTVSDVGGWDLDIHHRYNPQEGILYKGDGSNVYLSERPRLIFNLMGKFFLNFLNNKYDQLGTGSWDCWPTYQGFSAGSSIEYFVSQQRFTFEKLWWFFLQGHSSETNF